MSLSSPVFAIPEITGLVESIRYELVYYGTHQALLEFFSRGLSEDVTIAIDQQLYQASMGKVYPLMFKTTEGQFKFYMFRVFSEEIIENLYVGIKRIIKLTEAV